MKFSACTYVLTPGQVRTLRDLSFAHGDVRGAAEAQAILDEAKHGSR